MGCGEGWKSNNLKGRMINVQGLGIYENDFNSSYVRVIFRSAEKDARVCWSVSGHVKKGGL